MRAPALALLLACTPIGALAMDNGREIAGEWVFESPLEDLPECIIDGRATISPTRRRGVFQVRTIGAEHCGGGRVWRTEQDCVGTLQGRRFTIECELISAEPSNYYRDNFTLVVMHDDLMIGALISTRTGSSTWRRAPSPLVS